MDKEERDHRIFHGSAGVALMLMAPAMIGLVLTGGENAPQWVRTGMTAMIFVVALLVAATGAWAIAGAFLGRWPR